MQISNDTPQMLTVEEIAARLRLTEEHTRRLLRSGDLPGIKRARLARRGQRIDAVGCQPKCLQKIIMKAED